MTTGFDPMAASWPARAPDSLFFLWTGPKHAGKTTQAAGLVRLARREGLRVAGLLAPSVYEDGHLAGFEALNLRTEARAPLAVRQAGPGDVGRFRFRKEGLRLGRAALDEAATAGADLVIVDEFGPLELAGRGWRRQVDALVQARGTALVVVVRRELAGAVREVYASTSCRLLDALAPASAAEVVQWLRGE